MCAHVHVNVCTQYLHLFVLVLQFMQNTLCYIDTRVCVCQCLCMHARVCAQPLTLHISRMLDEFSPYNLI